jgi:hypothetical protein
VLDEKELFLAAGDDVVVEPLLERPRVAVVHRPKVLDLHEGMIRAKRALLPLPRYSATSTINAVSAVDVIPKGAVAT